MNKYTRLSLLLAVLVVPASSSAADAPVDGLRIVGGDLISERPICAYSFEYMQPPSTEKQIISAKSIIWHGTIAAPGYGYIGSCQKDSIVVNGHVTAARYIYK